MIIFENEHSRRALEHWVERVSQLKPGQLLYVYPHDLQDIQSHEHNGATFSPADRILGNIVGSAYTHSYSMHPSGRFVTFERHEDTGVVWHRDPDRRQP